MKVRAVLTAGLDLTYKVAAHPVFLLFAALAFFAFTLGMALGQELVPGPATPVLTDEPLPSLNPTEWFLSVASLAATVRGFVWLIRKHVLKTLDGVAVIVASAGTTVILVVIGRFVPPLLGMPALLDESWLRFGVQTFVLASGFTAMLPGSSSSLPANSPAPAGTTRDDRDRSRAGM